SPAIPLRAMANMSSISCATTCGRRLPVSARKGSRAAPSATRDGASYPQYAFQAAAISGFTSRITRQLMGRAAERAAATSATKAVEVTRRCMLAVGTEIAARPPHGAVLAPFMHTALTLSNGRQSECLAKGVGFVV